MILAVGIVGAGGVALWGLNAVRAPGPLSEPTNVVIEHGQPTTEIGAVLEREGVVSDQRLFVLSTYLTRSARGPLKAGEYEFPAGASLAEVLSILRSGRSVVHKVTIPEGFTSAQVVERVNAHPALIGTVSEVPAEGSLLPDTYVFRRGTEREVILARMRDAQARLVDDLWEERDPDLPFETKEEAIILASIVEKETALAEERPEVAAVFINRLRQNMRLQSDPTIIYGITNGERSLDRPIRRSDISESTPYNTYRIDGLPPTPIANPGREAIAAVLQPGTTDHLYFVADGSGGHAFARTLDEHNKNVARWREIERAARSESSQATLEEDAEEGIEESDAPAAEAGEEPADPAAEDVEAADPTEASVPLPDDDSTGGDATGGDATGGDATGGDATGEGRADEIVAAVAARGRVSPEDAAEAAPEAAPEASADAAAAPSETAAFEPETDSQPESDPVGILAEGDVPIPKPKPARN